MKNACLILPNFKIKSELKRRPYLSKRQILISGFNGNKEVVVDYTSNINGVFKGSLLKDVLLRIKNPVILTEDDKYYSHVQDQIIGKLFKLFGCLEVNGYECIYIDTSYICRDASGRLEIANTILDSLSEDFNPLLGFSTGKYSSYISALMSSPSDFNVLKFDKKHIGELSTGLMPISDQLKKRMQVLGLINFKRIADCKKEHLLSQFGEAGKFIWHFANGIDDSEITPLEIRDFFSKEIEFSYPTDNYDVLLVAMESLLIEAFAFLEMTNKYPRKISITCFVLGGTKWIKTITFKTHQYDEKYANNILKQSLYSYVFSGPVATIQVQIDEAEYRNGFQLNLFANMRKEISLKESIREFKSRFATESPFYNIRDFEPYSRIPERRQILVRYDP